jgi:putative FmdB family regulatory protein
VTYVYECVKCKAEFDVIKSVRDIENNEFCPDCGAPGERQFVPHKVFFSGTAVQNAEYNPALGMVTRNKEHRAEICKQRGLVEIGNDYKSPESLHKELETNRADKRKRSWDEV